MDKFQDVAHKYQVVKTLGIGSYGIVVQAIQLSTKKKVAIKRFDQLFNDLVDAKRVIYSLLLLDTPRDHSAQTA